jgi:hypothetical protein
MKILAMAKDAPGTTPEDFQPYLELEAKSVWELYKNGIVREMYFRQESPDAVLVLECEDLSQAEMALDELPLVKQGLIEFNCIGLVPYPGFERLFQEIRS